MSTEDLQWLKIKTQILLEPAFALPLEAKVMKVIRELPAVLRVDDELMVSFDGIDHQRMAEDLEFGTTTLPRLGLISRISRMLLEDFEEKISSMELV